MGRPLIEGGGDVLELGSGVWARDHEQYRGGSCPPPCRHRPSSTRARSRERCPGSAYQAGVATLEERGSTRRRDKIVTTRRRTLALVPCAATLGITSFAGTTTQDPDDIEDLPPTKIAERAFDATKGVDSLRIKGKVTSGPDQIRLDLALNSQGDCTGTIGVDEATARLIRAEGITYLKGDEAFWKAVDAGSNVTNLLADQWLKAPDQVKGADELTGVCDLDNLLKVIPSRAAAPGLTKGEVHEINGKSAIPVTRKDGNVTHRMDVATEGKPYILKITTTGSAKPETLTLSEFNKPVKAKAPPAEDVIDLEDLEEQ